MEAARVEAARLYALPEAVAAREAVARQKAKHTGNYVRHMHQRAGLRFNVWCKLMWLVVVV